MQEKSDALPRTLAGRLRWLRDTAGLTLTQFASKIGYNKGYLSLLESGKAANPSARFIVAVSMGFNVSAKWLQTGEGRPFQVGEDQATRISLPDWSEDRLGKIYAVLHDLPDALATDAVLGHLLRSEGLAEIQAVWREIGLLPNLPGPARLFWNAAFTQLQFAKMDRPSEAPQEAESEALKKHAEKLTNGPVEPIMPKLRERLRQQTAAHGSKTALARLLGVPRQSVNDWLAGRKEPGGETTLRLLRWVEQAERQQAQGCASVSPPAGPKNRAGKTSSAEAPPEG